MKNLNRSEKKSMIASFDCIKRLHDDVKNCFLLVFICVSLCHIVNPMTIFFKWNFKIRITLKNATQTATKICDVYGFNIVSRTVSQN